MSECFFGVHVGNTNACLAVYKDDKCDVVANDFGDRVTPTHVAFNNKGKEIVVGLAAKQGQFRNPKSTISKNKTLLSGTYDPEMPSLLAKVIHEAKTYKYNVDAEERILKVTMEEVHIHILKSLRDIAESHNEALETKDAVFAVPLSFSEEQRKIIALCCKKAGFNVLQIINEPIAACLAYDIGQKDPSLSPPQIIVVYRAGGCTSDVTVVRANGGVYTVLSNVQTKLGGEKLTELLSGYLADEFKRKYKADPRETKRGVFKLFTNAENVKHVLSTLDTSNCYIESLYEGIDFSCNVTRARFENEISKVLSDFIAPVHDALSKAKLSSDDVTKCVLLGGTCKIPKIQNAISGIFKNADVLKDISFDEVIAIGCANQASILNKVWESPLPNETVNATTMPITFSFVENCDVKDVLIPAQIPIPVRRSHHLALNPDVTKVSLKIFAQQFLLAELTLDELTNESKLSLSAHIYRDGGLHLALTDKKTAKCDQVTINAASSS